MKTADLYDTHGDALRLCHLPFLQLGRKTAFHGPVATVKCVEDNALLKSELQKPGEGRVMVVDGGGSTRRALLGDMIALILHENGWAGIVINGAVRDRAEIDAMPVGVRCLGTSPVKSAKAGVGQKDVPVTFGNVDIRPGMYLWADEDGVVVADGPLS
jgi:regulator of ribonuclease activity A